VEPLFHLPRGGVNQLGLILAFDLIEGVLETGHQRVTRPLTDVIPDRQRHATSPSEIADRGKLCRDFQRSVR